MPEPLGSIALRVQQLPLRHQVLILARLAQGRNDLNRFSPSEVEHLFDDLTLPRPVKIANVLIALERDGLVARPKNTRGAWHVTPSGKDASAKFADEMDLAALTAQLHAERGAIFGDTIHPIVQPWMAPPELLGPVRGFLRDFPFDGNVFGMTRFPDETKALPPDPVTPAIAKCRAVCAAHGLVFHLASDRSMVDDLWGNVAAHMWASRYGVAFFEDTGGASAGVNLNLTIEVGSMTILGRRTALLKDKTIAKLPTDLIGKIYKPVDLLKGATVEKTMHTWIRDDLSLGRCADC